MAGPLVEVFRALPTMIDYLGWRIVELKDSKMSTEIGYLDQLRAQLDQLLSGTYRTLHWLLALYSNQDLIILFQLHRYEIIEGEMVERFHEYEDLKEYINRIICRSGTNSLPPAPLEGWGAKKIMVKTLMQGLRAQFLPKELGPEEIVNFMDMYFDNPKDTEKLWALIVAFRMEIDAMNAEQYGE
jgi:hypothetical protein